MVRADAHTVWRGHGLNNASVQALVATLCGHQVSYSSLMLAFLIRSPKRVNS